VVFVVDAVDDFRGLAERIPHRWSDRNPTLAPDWGSILDEGEIDAVHVTNHAVAEARGN
jgi:hypothetical protein